MALVTEVAAEVAGEAALKAEANSVAKIDIAVVVAEAVIAIALPNRAEEAKKAATPKETDNRLTWRIKEFRHDPNIY